MASVNDLSQDPVPWQEWRWGWQWGGIRAGGLRGGRALRQDVRGTPVQDPVRPWLEWLSWLGIGLQSKRSLVDPSRDVCLLVRRSPVYLSVGAPVGCGVWRQQIHVPLSH